MTATTSTQPNQQPNEPSTGSAAQDAVGNAPARRATTARRARSAQFASSSAETLPRYVSEMSRLRMFSREEELSAATHVAAAELAFWTELLSYPPALGVVGDELDAALAKQEAVTAWPALAQLRTLAQQPPAAQDKAWLTAWRAASEVLAQDLRKHDTSRDLMRTMFALVKDWCRAELDAVDEPALHLHAYRRRVQDAHRHQAQAKQRFSSANLRLVLSIARRYNRGRMPLSDLIQEGNLGLMTAVERFDPARGFRFSTYASWWIRHAIHRSIADKSRTVRVPVHRQDLSQRIARLKSTTLAHKGRLPTMAELIEQTGESPKKLQDIQDQPDSRSWSLNREVGDEDGCTFLDLLVDDTAPSSDELASNNEWKAQLEQLLTELKPIEARILQARFGLDGNEELTLRDLGLEFGLSRERVRQLQERALKQLRHRVDAMASPAIAS